MAKRKKEERLDADSVWKDILEKYFAEFMGFFFPLAYEQIDWSKGVEWLDKEFQQVVADAEMGRRYADKLAKVWLKNGEEMWVLAHVEIQGQYEKSFGERLYTYNYRIFDRYKKPVATFAVLTDERENWRPEQFSYEVLGTRMMLNFSIVKLIDYRERMAELEASKNVFSIVVMAHLETLATREKPQERLDSKLRVVRKLYEKGYEKEDIIELFRFIDWLMRLPEALEEKFFERLTEIEETNMPYVTSIERIGEKRGIEIGRVEGLEQGLVQGIEKGRVEEGLALIMRQLKRRVGVVSLEQEGQLKKLTLEQLEELGEALLDFQGEQDLRKWLAAVAPDKEG